MLQYVRDFSARANNAMAIMVTPRILAGQRCSIHQEIKPIIVSITIYRTLECTDHILSFSEHVIGMCVCVMEYQVSTNKHGLDV